MISLPDFGLEMTIAPNTVAFFFDQIRDIAAKTLISVESKINTQIQVRVSQRDSCFEIFGFDILFDENYRAWLLEVNTFPDLAASSPLDMEIKSSLVEDMLHMVGVVPCDVGALKKRATQKRQKALQAAKRYNYVHSKNPSFQKTNVMEAQKMEFEGRKSGQEVAWIRYQVK